MGGGESRSSLRRQEEVPADVVRGKEEGGEGTGLFVVQVSSMCNEVMKL